MTLYEGGRTEGEEPNDNPDIWVLFEESKQVPPPAEVLQGPPLATSEEIAQLKKTAESILGSHELKVTTSWSATYNCREGDLILTAQKTEGDYEDGDDDGVLTLTFVNFIPKGKVLNTDDDDDEPGGFKETFIADSETACYSANAVEAATISNIATSLLAKYQHDVRHEEMSFEAKELLQALIRAFEADEADDEARSKFLLDLTEDQVSTLISKTVKAKDKQPTISIEVDEALDEQQSLYVIRVIMADETRKKLPDEPALQISLKTDSREVQDVTFVVTQSGKEFTQETWAVEKLGNMPEEARGPHTPRALEVDVLTAHSQLLLDVLADREADFVTKLGELATQCEKDCLVEDHDNSRLIEWPPRPSSLTALRMSLLILNRYDLNTDGLTEDAFDHRQFEIAMLEEDEEFGGEEKRPSENRVLMILDRPTMTIPLVDDLAVQTGKLTYFTYEGVVVGKAWTTSETGKRELVTGAVVLGDVALTGGNEPKASTGLRPAVYTSYLAARDLKPVVTVRPNPNN